MPDLKGTKTHNNLKEAFAGESQANRRYLYFAKVADVEGYPDVAGNFRDTAEGETGHAHGHLDYLKQAGDPPYSARYPELARLKAAPDVSFVCRNVLVRCKTTLLRDGGVERTALNVATDQPVDLNSLLDERAFGGNPLLRRALFERIPLSEIGPYLHPWRAAAGR